MTPDSACLAARDGLVEPPRPQFFMNVADLAFWLMSARSDAYLANVRADAAGRFDALYTTYHDPYGTVTARYRYQQRKYRRLLSMVPARPFRTALDLGCGLGAFTLQLAPHVERVLGVDVSQVAIERARSRAAGSRNVAFVQGDLNDVSAFGAPFDLITMIDVLYYLPGRDCAGLSKLIAQVRAMLSPNGVVLVANHSFFGIDASSRETKAIHTAFQSSRELALIRERWFPFFLASVLEAR